ncbi:hypothetical protein M422DRAFT_780739 [Sphaerobolus stellatus SS14]|uniref:Unplaced genomic scaffold SPHSTscaffold_70, whole genome shotgun sequence n=1 Tax=Sphaerobolus stellatus (strain SS14) TaxID=990650 RepID=A0A0C9VQR6_SPHS4|nr:hypothetical protein M422DRAFT_780739 [Sphaerobolus stellatus SS14]
MGTSTKEWGKDIHDRHPPFWHENGNIILSVKDDHSGEEHQFKIHKYVLKLHSTVFRDMLEVGQAHELCSTVALKGDSVDDVCALLRVLYTGFMAYDTLTFENALGILRLSDKYLFDELRAAVIRLLKRNWPLNREEYIHFKKAYPEERNLKCIQLIKTANLTRAHELLPTAFFELAVCDHDILDRIQPTDPPSIHGLSQADLSRILIGRQLLIKNCSMTINHIPRGNIGRGWHEEFCNCSWIDRKLALWNDFHLTKWISPGYLPDVDVYGALMKHLDLTGSTDDEGYCPDCNRWLIHVCEQAAVNMWKDIPRHFHLPKVDQAAYKRSKDPFVLL